MSTSHCIKWYHGTDPLYCWFIRGIKPDRSFYGEINAFCSNGGRGVTVTGSLSASDHARLLLLVSEIEDAATVDESDEPWKGLLAEGPVMQPRIIFRYRGGGKEPSSAEAAFLAIIDLLAPYLDRFYEDLP